MPHDSEPTKVKNIVENLYIPKIDICMGFTAPRRFVAWLTELADAIGCYGVAHFPILYALQRRLKLVDDFFVPLIGIEIETSINKHLSGGILNLAKNTYAGVVVTKASALKHVEFYKKELGIYESKRTAKNVISNGIIAFMMAAFGGYYLPFVGGFIGSIATATADTMASEIGILQQPRLITTMKKVAPGTDGAVSILGTLVGIVGAGTIGIAAYLLGIMSDPFLSFKIAVISGTIGCFMDSILGAVLERRNFLNNEHVNLLATITGAVIGIIFTIH
jgi:uncharacterized protein (TIGR00297 family)